MVATLALLAIACTAPVAGEEKILTVTGNPEAATPASTPTAIPQARVIIPNTPVYTGPSNVGYDIVARLPENSEITPVGTYVDFVKVVGVDGQSGFVWKEALENVPALPELTADQVPLKQLINILDKIYDPRTTVEGDVLCVDNSNHNDWYGYEEVWRTWSSNLHY